VPGCFGLWGNDWNDIGVSLSRLGLHQAMLMLCRPGVGRNVVSGAVLDLSVRVILKAAKRDAHRADGRLSLCETTLFRRGEKATVSRDTPQKSAIGIRSLFLEIGGGDPLIFLVRVASCAYG